MLEGLTAVVTVRLPEPQFEGQTKEVLGTPAAASIVAHVVSARAQGALRQPPARRQAAGPRGAGEGRRRRQGAHRGPGAPREPAPQVGAGQLVAAGQAGRLPQRRRSTAASCSSSRATPRWAPPSWPGTRSSRRCCRSAARSSTCRRRRVADMLKNAECASIIQVIGAGSGRSFDLDSARYGKVILMADADVDGAHIRTPAADAVPPLHAADGRGRAGLRRGAAAAPHRADQPGQGPGQVHLHLLRRGAAPDAAGARAARPALEGAGAALQGPR